jgi:hypothetical protein
MQQPQLSVTLKRVTILIILTLDYLGSPPTFIDRLYNTLPPSNFSKHDH